MKCSFLCNEINQALYVTRNIEDGELCLFSFHYELWDNILGKLFSQYKNVQNTKENNQNYCRMQKQRLM
jgi:hypothetical protein